MPSRPAGDLFAWNRALRGNVSGLALGLAHVLATRMERDGTIPARFRPSLDTLASDMRFKPSSGRRSVSRLINELEDAGFLLVERGGGKHVVNGYTAALPVSETGPQEAQNAADTGSLDEPNCCSGSTHPSLSSQNPSLEVASGGAVDLRKGSGAGTGTPETRESNLTAEERAQANAVIQRALEALPAADAEQLAQSFPSMKHREVMARRIARLVGDGWEDEVISVLTRKQAEWSQSPYAGSSNAAATAAGRIRRLDRELTRKRVDPASFAPALRVHNS
jgi:hypothetical protein